LHVALVQLVLLPSAASTAIILVCYSALVLQHLLCMPLPTAVHLFHLLFSSLFPFVLTALLHGHVSACC